MIFLVMFKLVIVIVTLMTSHDIIKYFSYDVILIHLVLHIYNISSEIIYANHLFDIQQSLYFCNQYSRLTIH